MTIQDIRSKYPQYNHVSDGDLASTLHSKYYSHVPVDKFYKKIGFDPTQNNIKEIIKTGYGINVPIYQHPRKLLADYGVDKTRTLQQQVNDMNRQSKIDEFKSQDQPLQDSSLDFIPGVPGGMLKNVVVNHVAQGTSEAASKVVDKMTPEYMKAQHPDYYNAMQLVAQFGTGGIVINHAIPENTIARYQEIDQAVKKGDLTLEQADKAVKEVSKIPEPVNNTVKDATNPTQEELMALAQKHLEDTKQTKVLDETNPQNGAKTPEAQIQDAHIEAIKQDEAIKKTTDELINAGVTDPKEIETAINSNIKPTETDNLITSAINDGKPLSADLSGANIFMKLKNTIENLNSTRTPDTIYAELLNKGATDELAHVAAASFEQRDPLIFTNWYNDKIKSSILNDAKKSIKGEDTLSDTSTPQTVVKNTSDTSGNIIPKNDSENPNFTLSGDAKDKTRNLENIQVEDWVKEVANLSDKDLSANLFILQAKHPELFKNTADVYRTLLEIKNNPTHFYKNNRPDISLIAKRLEDGSLGKLGVAKETNNIIHLSKSTKDREQGRLERVNNKQLEVGSPYPTLRPSDKLPEHGDGANALSPTSDTILPKNSENSKVNPNVLQSSPTVGSATLGLSAGIQTDDNGNISYNLAKGVVGALGASIAYKGASKLYDIYKTRGIKAIQGALPPQSKTEALRQLLQDKFTRVAQLQKVKAGVQEIADEFDTYRAEERYSGKAQDRVETFWKDKVDPILKEMAQKDIKIEDVDEYLHARHAIERNAKMKELGGIENGSGMSDMDAAKILLKYKDNKELQNIASKTYEINKDRLKLMLESGLESTQKVKDIESLYDNYTPLNRDMGDRAIQQSSGKGFSVKGSGLKNARGSDLAVESPLMHTILNYQDTLVRAEKNKVGQTFLNFINKYPDETLYSVENLKYMPQYTKEGTIKNLNPLYKKGDNILHVMVDGKMKQIELKDPALAIALKNLNQAQMNAFLKVAHKSVRAIASLATSYNPEFIVSNMERDLQTAMINLPKEAKPSYYKFLRDMPSALRGIYRNERGKKLSGTYQKIFQGMKKNGGTTGWLEQFEIPEMRVDLQQKIRKYQGKDLFRNTFTEIFKYINDVNTAIENAPRLIAYKQSIDAGLTPAKSANIAKNLTVNFNKKGTGGTFLNTVYMFYNASIQGSVRTLQALKSTKGKIAVSGIAASGYGLHQYNKMVNEDAYNKIPQFEKDTNYIFMHKDGTYDKVKLPYGYNVFKVLGDISAEIQNGETTKSEATSRIMGAVANAFSPIGASGDIVTTLMPTLIKPAYEIKTNENFFGAPIKPEGNPFEPDKLAQSHQYFDSVNPQIKDFAQNLNALTGGTKYTRGYVDVSPEYIQHMMQFITSGLGTFTMRTATSVKKAIKGEKQDINQIPFYRLFVGRARDKAETNIAYNLYKESATKVLSAFKVKQFESSIIEAIKKQDIDPKKAVKLLRKFTDNQARTKWSEKNNIQSSKDTIKHLRSAAQQGVSKSGLIDLAKQSMKDINKNKRDPKAPLIKF